jgi:hypothetical protein
MLGEEMSRRGTSPVLIGRGEQTAALASALTAVRPGGPAAVLIGGTAGMTTLLPGGGPIRELARLLAGLCETAPGKLGTASRTEAAARAHALRLFDGACP